MSGDPVPCRRAGCGVAHRLLRRHGSGSFQRLRREPARIEAEIGGLLLPDAPQFSAVDIAFSGPGHQGGALGEALVFRRRSVAAGVHRRLDLGAPGGERLDRGPGNAGNLEAAVGMGLFDAVS